MIAPRRPETLVIDEAQRLLEGIDVDAELNKIIAAGRKSEVIVPLQHPPALVQHATLEAYQASNLPTIMPTVVDGTVQTSLTVPVEPSPWPARIYHGLRYGVAAALAGLAITALIEVVSVITGFVASHEAEVIASVLIAGVILWRGLKTTRRHERGGKFIQQNNSSLTSINHQWIMEMRHGGWRQSTVTYGNGRNSHCALGVLYRVANGGQYHNGDFRRQDLVDLGYSPEFLYKVENMNQRGRSFNSIARYVERETSRGRGWAHR